MPDARYHARFVDQGGGETLPLMFQEAGGILGYSKRLANPYAAKASEGETRYSDLTEWSVATQADWRGGRGQEEMEEADAYLDSYGTETRIDGQLTLGPLRQGPASAATDPPQHTPSSVTPYGIGYPAKLKLTSAGGQATDVQIFTTAKAAQQILIPPGPFDWRIGTMDVKVKNYGATAALRLDIYSDSGNEPGSTLANASVAAGSISSSYTWITFTFGTPLAVTNATKYWIVLTSTAATAKTGYGWRVDPLGGYPDGFQMLSLTGGDWWRVGLNDGTFRVGWSKIEYEQSFTTPSGGVTCSHALVKLQMYGTPQTVTLSLYDDSGGSPNTLLKTTTGTIVHNVFWPVGTWVKFTWASAQSLSGNTVYHLVLTAPASREAFNDYVGWYGDTTGGYASGAVQKRVDGGAWAAVSSVDLTFQINNLVLAGNPVAFKRFLGSWYCAAGDRVYKWNDSTKYWDSVDDDASTITDMEVWGGKIWIARGDDDYMRNSSDGASWSDVGTLKATYLMGGGGYLYRSDGTSGSEEDIYYTVDGSTWSDAISVGAGDYVVNAMAWYRDQFLIATATRLWGTVADFAYPLVDWSSQEDPNNGKNMITWSRDGNLYIPLRFGLYRFNGDTMVPVGPEQGTGLPAARAGRVADLVGTGNWLYAAIDGGASLTSSILAYNGLGGWHEIQRADNAGENIAALGFETVHSPNRLWFGMETMGHYLELPDTSDNPYAYTGYEFNPSGEVVTSWWGADLIEVIKDLHEVVVRGEDFTSTVAVDVYYEIDRSGRWTYLGRVTNAPQQRLAFASSEFDSTTLAAGSTATTIELASGSVTTEMEAGDWVRIGGEIAQIASITDSDTFVLETALSAAPLSGVMCYAARPAGREFRLKLVLQTNSNASTPKIKAIIVRYQNNVLDRFVYQLQIRVEDGMEDLKGAVFPYDVATFEAKLDLWARRVTPFTFEDPYGNARLVKIISAGEGGLKRIEKDAQPPFYQSVYNVNLVEVA